MKTQFTHILIVDDDLLNVEILALFLTRRGYLVTAAYNGNEALQQVNSQSIDLVLLDVNMPLMNGYEVCRRLKNSEATKDIPVIFVTALGELSSKLEGFAVGGADYIQKPFEFPEVLARINLHLKMRWLHQQLLVKTQHLEIQNQILQEQVCANLGFKHELYKDLKDACVKQQFEVYYQPIVNFIQGTVTGFEALLRWKHPSKGFISPADFIPLAECTGLIDEITAWVIQEVHDQIHLWNQHFPSAKNISVGVNISPNQLADQWLLEVLRSTLRTSQISPQQLKIEITEGVLVKHFDTSVGILRNLQDMGIQLCIDDFGTGYSSLSRLYDFPCDILKIDRSFINQEKWVLVKTIIDLAKNLNKLVIAEGVETLEQRHELLQLSCYQGQGYYFSRPVPASTATSFLSDRILSNSKVSSTLSG